jgi:hypothetical protein
MKFESTVEQISPRKKCTAFVLPICDLSGFQRFPRKLVIEVEPGITVDFPCISGEIRYDSVSGWHLGVGIESYLRSHFFQRFPSRCFPFCWGVSSREARRRTLNALRDLRTVGPRIVLIIQIYY